MRLKERLQISVFNPEGIIVPRLAIRSFSEEVSRARRAIVRNLFAFFFILFCTAGHLFAEESILNYNSLIEVQRNSELIITEKITVRAEGNKIRRGIYRDFPTDYTDKFGHRYAVGFKILDIERDRWTEKYHTERRPNGIRIYIGSANVMLPPGEYTYTIKFKTNRQLGFFQDHDELYFNAIGTGWDFPVGNAVIAVSLPEDISPSSLRLDGFTGPQGATRKDFSVHKDPNLNFITYRLTKPLYPYEGLTVLVGFEKGKIIEPSLLQKWKYFFSDNKSVLIGLLGFISALIYYLVTWNFVGRDPRKGAIFPQWEIPPDLNAADIRFLYKLGYDKKTFTSMLVGMAIKGLVEIEYSESGKYTLVRKEAAKAEPLEEELMQILFQSGDKLVVKQDNYSEIKTAIDTLEERLKEKHLKKTFYSNVEFVLPAIIIMLITFYLEWSSSGYEGGSLFSAGIFMVGFGFMALHLYFRYLLKAPTLQGRKTLDKIEGLKMYLTIAEKDSLVKMKNLDEQPALYEKFLPFALALGVENEWSKKFASAFNMLSEQGRPYQPYWYSSRSMNRSFDLGTFSSGFSDTFTSSIASSSVPPGSKSGFSSGGGGGFSGGGSSGGGGGGGGGGGW
jgi:uncharacterized membrane protein YgcG